MPWNGEPKDLRPEKEDGALVLITPRFNYVRCREPGSLVRGEFNVPAILTNLTAIFYNSHHFELTSRVAIKGKRSERETTTDCRSKVVVAEIGDAGAMRNGDGQTAAHPGIRNSGKTVETLGEVMIRIQ